MSDSFADLWAASATPQQKPQTLGAHRPPQTTSQTAKKDVFSLLASTTSNNRPSRSITPATMTSKPPTPAASTSSGDAFDDLFSSATGNNPSSKGSTSQMTLAARLAMEANQKRTTSTPSPSPISRSTTNASSNDAWAGLDALMGGATAGGSSITRSSSTASQPPVKAFGAGGALLDDDDDWGLGDFGSVASKPTLGAVTSSLPTPAAAAAAAPKPQKPITTTSSSGGSLWDLDDFGVANPAPIVSSRSSSSQATRAPPQSKIDDGWGSSFDTPDHDFDFGNREDRDVGGGLLDQDEHHQDSDDILGMLSQPVEQVKKVQRPPPSRPSPPAQQHQQKNRRPSPPPHVLGQIVEMGFSVAQAKQALANTPNGTDVAAALESLLNSSESSGSGPVPPIQPRRPSPSSDPAPTPTTRRGAPKGFRERERERLERQRSENEARSGSATPLSLNDVQDQADKLLSQASAIGISALSKASAFWKTTVVKAYEERSGSGANTPSQNGPTKPKWMQDAEDAEPPTPTLQTARHGGFRDDDGDDGGEREEHHQIPRRRPDTPPRPPQQLQEAEPEIDLFSSAPVPQQQQQQRRPHPQTRSQPPRPTNRTTSTSTPPARAPTTPRNLPTIAPHTLSTITQHKETGTSQFKLGQYGSAVEAYTLAISNTPKGHLLLVPLFTNRALGRIKTGEYRGAVEDAEGALGIICGGGSGSGNGGDPNAEFLPSDSSTTTTTWNWNWNPVNEDPAVLEAGQTKVNQGGWAHPQGLGVDLVDSYVKAVRRRSEALEGREKWAEAGRGWEVLAGSGWIPESVRKEAARGAARCRTMVSGGGGGGSAGVNGSLPSSSSSVSRTEPTAKPKPKPIPARTPQVPITTKPSEALRTLRNANAEADAEDTLKHTLKDSVDARLGAWKNGKETNIRALLASLDLVLWDSILEGGVKPAGLHVLVTPAQVKKGYVKAIARVHPDKLNASNSTVEQRMLANGAFGVLNEAWLAFQASGQ